jgi:pimeloyl-ACP methyl ester carboxylesterase
MVITQAGVDERVTQLLYVVSVMPEAGQSMADLTAREPAPWMVPGDDGTVGVDADIVAELFLQDCDEHATRHALQRLTRQCVTAFTQPLRQAAWQHKPSTYVVCTEDLAIPAQTQRRRIKPAARQIDFRAGHHPFLARPDAFAQSIIAAIDPAG